MRRVKSLRSYLIQLVLVAVVPLLVFSCGLIFYVSHQQNKSLESTLYGRTKSIQAVIDDKLNSILSSLEILALTEEFDPTQFPVIHRRLSRAVHNLPGWKSISIVDLDGHLLLHTAHPFGAKLAPLTQEAFFLETLRTTKPVFSDLRNEKNTGDNIISISMPISIGKRFSLILIANISYDLIVQTLKGQNLPNEWYATVVDNSKRIIARSRLEEKFVGSKISGDLNERLESSPSGFLKSVNKEKIHSFSVFTHSSLTN